MIASTDVPSTFTPYLSRIPCVSSSAPQFNAVCPPNVREHYRSRLILQVHDELLIETAEEEKEKVIALLEEEMQKAADLKVELAVGTACGQDWYEAH